MDEAGLRRALMRWYRRSARDLPWRRTKDPYSVWVSEVMLRQTRVDVATPYFLRWMARFPTVEALAAAEVDDVLRQWSGLGYYSRARNLHAAAKLVAAQGWPQGAAALHALPGVGAYTAGAVASIAQGERVAAVDGNVVRVLARLAAWPGAASDPALKKKVDRLAARLVPKTRPGDWNQALMDLGATVCTPRNPRCAECPLTAKCKAFARGLQESIPAPKKAGKPTVERHAFAVVQRNGQVLLVRNPSRGLLAGLWSLPGGPADGDLAAQVLAQAGAVVQLHGTPAAARHQFSHRTWEMEVDGAVLVDPAAEPAQRETAWVDIADLDGAALSTAMRTAMSAVGVGTPRARKPSEGKAKRRKGSGPS